MRSSASISSVVVRMLATTVAVRSLPVIASWAADHVALAHPQHELARRPR